MVKLTEQEELFITAMIETKGNARVSASKAGYSENYGFSLARKFHENIIKAAKEVLALHSIQSAYTLTDALDPENPVHRDRLEAAKQILDRIGIVKEEKIEVKTTLPGIMFLPEKDKD